MGQDSFPPVRILCVDDQLANLISLEAALGGQKYALVNVTSGAEALAEVEKFDFAVILLDVQMPYLDGFKTAALIRKIERARHTPIIFLTANYPSEAHALVGYEVGAVDYLFKPLNIEILRAKVAVFADLFRTKQEFERQAQMLRELERREKERQLSEVRKQGEQRYQNLVEGIQNGIVWAADPTTLDLSYVSPQAEEVSGYSQAQWVTEPSFWQRHVHPDDLKSVLDAFHAVQKTQGRIAVEHRFIKPFGESVWLHTDVHMDLNTNSKEPELRGLSIDITHLKEAIRLRDEFLWIASHELRTPITPLLLQMQGFLRMFETGRFHSTPEHKLKEMLEISEAQVTRLGRLIHQLLDVSRAHEGRLKLDRESVDLSELVQSVYRQLEHEVLISECSVHFDLEPGIIGQFDRLRIEQVLINLLMNAIKYAPGKAIVLRVHAQDGWCTLSVRDFGIGIAKYDQERIFGRFERAAPVRKYGGLGLGLYISKQIVDLHGGTIHVESEINRGSTFVVRLPLAQPRSQSISEPPLSLLKRGADVLHSDQHGKSTAAENHSRHRG